MICSTLGNSQYGNLKRGISRAVQLSIIAIIIVIVVGAGFYAVISTRSSSTSSSTSTSTYVPSSVFYNNTLTIDASAWPAPASLNQLYAFAGEGPWPNYDMYSVYQPLVSVNESAAYGTGVIQYLPGLAENWTISPDSTTYTFSLRHGVYFSNGDPFNAYQLWLEDYGYYYLQANASNWWANYALFNMTNVNFGPGTISLVNASGVLNPSSQALAIMQNSSWPIYVTSQYQIVYHLDVPFQWFLGTLVSYQGLIFDSQWVLDHGGFGTPTSINSYFNNNPMPGTGPYVVTSVSPNAYVLYQQDSNYWAKNDSALISMQPIFDPGHVKDVEIKYVADDLARYTDLSTGTAQMADIEINDWSQVQSNSQYGYVTEPSWGGQTMLLGLQTHDYPTNITLVRQAIVHAINYTDLYNKAYLGLMSPYMGPEYPAWSNFYDLGGFQDYQYNLTLAQQDLAAAHISNMPAFSMIVWSGCNTCENAAQVIQSDLKQIGITVNLQVETESDAMSVLGNYQTNVANAQQIGQLTFIDSGGGWGPTALTPADDWQSFVSNTSTWGNQAAYYNPIVQSCVNGFFSADSTSTLQSLCTAAQKQIYNDAPYAWIGVSRAWLPEGGSTVYNKNVISGFLLDPTWTGQSSIPFINTITFV
ncbi:MAG: ABC transporter substrate-binding protein [archaeon]|nr:ABC transporter substrate-binding protein [archaeon]